MERNTGEPAQTLSSEDITDREAVFQRALSQVGDAIETIAHNEVDAERIGGNPALVELSEVSHDELVDAAEHGRTLLAQHIAAALAAKKEALRLQNTTDAKRPLDV